MKKLISLLIFILLSCDENTKSYFKNYYDAVSHTDGIKNGWIPKYIPRSSTDIKGEFAVDFSNSRKVEFKFKAKEFKSFSENFNIIKNKRLLCPDHSSESFWCFHISNDKTYSKGFIVTTSDKCL